MRVYVDGEVFTVKTRKCVFLPRLKRHAWFIASESMHLMTLITLGGFLNLLIKMGAPAERMEIPKDGDTVTYANADLTETIKVHEHYGVRLLTPEEIRSEMPKYPVLRQNPAGFKISKMPQGRVTCYMDKFRRRTQLLRTTAIEMDLT